MISNKEEETYKIAKKYCEDLNGGEVILLKGDLGSGKTTFVKGVAEFFNIKKEEIISPTFTIFNNYKVENNKNIKNIIHIDAYRIENEEEFLETGALEYFYDKNTIVFIEWPENIKSFLGDTERNINLKALDENKREIII
ncbi:tRNA (adenosine(37)-N6)-threonylcarbamoyltransferase complex ATPase subunit type 1 TsaE [Patescibacteria group bacterium]|nr:tRNA (adenosine(37)-N6)-threonylcarbamoyltransferase complex ATPase subunit type 1 TsaE [Patescibacteria group bacterium]